MNPQGLQNILGVQYREFRDLLNAVFHRQCCYCESALGVSAEGEIELFRPRRVSDSKKSISPSVYLHLAADWRNLYLACPTCNRNKASRFPVLGERALEGMPYDGIIQVERPMLLDPCDLSEPPDQHLAFLPDGSVAGRTERGIVTVETLALNRSALMEARRLEAQRFNAASSAERVQKASSHGPYAAVWRQLLQVDSNQEFARSSRAASEKQKAADKNRTDVSTENARNLENYRAVARYIERVRIENFGPIRLLDIDLSQSQSSRAPCFALLGENGVGKSTLLRALAMTLAGKAYAKRLRLTSKAFLFPNAYKGEVRVSIVGQPDLVMTLRRNRAIEFSTETSQSLVLAYGATRLLPRGRHKPRRGERHAKIDNLFDPFMPLTDAEAWLAELAPARMSDVNAVLQRLLPAGQQLEVVSVVEGGKLRVRFTGDPDRQISELSDGYQSMLGMAVDIMQVMYLAHDSMEDAQGVVLIDELGNHFHPAWRLRCVSALREAFPQIQFIFSTHDPLCLRGLLGGEVAVLRRDRRREIYALEDLPPVNKLRVEQLLSSEHFGLHSTLDPVMEDLVEDYERLTQTADRSDGDEARLDEIVQELTDAHYLGASRRERLALRLLDSEGLPQVPEQSTIKVSSLSDNTVAKLRRLMREIAPAQELPRDQD
ncbi:AAA family ATPase [Delftia lacustris]|uniref:AAA family ATPase n=1 Tax=Delftia lacustris TaxID=558537 RepID=UPI0035A71D64